MLDFTERKDPNNKDREYVKTVSVVLNPKDNGGESVILDVDFYHNGDDTNAVYTNIHIVNQCYGVHSNKQSYYGVGAEVFEEAFRHMAEVATLVEKSGKVKVKSNFEYSGREGLESKEMHKLERIKELIENAEDYDVVHDIAAIVGADVK